MDITATVDIPCIELPVLGDLPKIPLLGGAELNAFIDVSGPPPSDCKLNFNLLLQLGPLFGSMACLFKILNVIAKLAAFVKAMTPSSVPPFKDLPAAIPDLATAIPKPTNGGKSYAFTLRKGIIPGGFAVGDWIARADMFYVMPERVKAIRVHRLLPVPGSRSSRSPTCSRCSRRSCC